MRIHYSLRFGAIACMAVFGLAASEHRGLVKFGGLPLPGATVTASQGDKKAVAVTDPQGVYSFPDLADGIWSMQVEMLCFTTLKREIAVAADAPAAEWEMKMLPLGEIKASAPPPSASAPPPSPATNASQNGGPPAASPPADKPQAATAAKPASKGKGKGSTASATNPQSGFQRADVNASAGAASSAPDAGAGPGSMGADAGQGASEAMVVNGSTSNGIERRAFGNGRRGPGSMFRGDLMSAESNSALNARNFSLTGQNTGQPSYNNAVFGGSFGGPFWIPHVLRSNGMFFIGYQGTRNRNATTNPTLMPTEQEINGDFTQAVGADGKPVQVYDPTTGAAFPGNAIPSARISDRAKALLKFYPQPNFLANSRYNYQVPLVSRSDTDGLQARVNRMLNTKNFVNGMFAYQRTSGLNPNLFGFTDTSSSTGMNSNVSWRHVFVRSVTGLLSYSYSRYSVRNTPFFAGRENVSQEAGITGNDQTAGNWGPPSLNFTSGIAGLSDGTLSLIRNQTSALSGNVLWIRRPHNMTFGGDFRRLQLNNLSQQNPRGQFTFNGTATEQMDNNGVPVLGSDFADFLLGIPDTASIAFGNADKYFRQGTYDLYANDDFRATSTLTINAGVRWEYSAPITEKYGRLVNLDVAPGFTNAAPVVANAPTGPVTHLGYPDSLLRPDKHAVQPRIGIAWHPFLGSSMVVRAGYGITYDTSAYNAIAGQMAQQSPLSKSLSVANTAANPLTLADAFHAPPGTLTNTFGIDPNFRIGYSQSWQLSVQQDIPGSMVATVTYLGIKGTRAAQVFLPNTYPPGAENPCATCQPGYSYTASNGNSTRESGMLQLRRRFHSGIAASASYTYSKSIDDAALGGRGQGNTVIAQNWLDLAAERGLSPFDQRHLLAIQMQYSTGVGVRGGTLLGGWRGAVVKGWTITSNVNAGSGLPETPISSQTVAGTGVVGPVRPLYNSGISVYDAPPGHFLNPAAYTAPFGGVWGTAGRNSIIGPSRFSLDASMSRTFSSFDLRLDAGNALNHVVYTSWVTNIGSSQFGLPNPPGNGTMRSVKVTLRWRF